MAGDSTPGPEERPRPTVPARVRVPLGLTPEFSLVSLWVLRADESRFEDAGASIFGRQLKLQRRVGPVVVGLVLPRM